MQVTPNRLVHALIASRNEAADDLLLEALRLGTEPEQAVALDALIRRQTTRGLGGVIGMYDALPESLQIQVLAQIRVFYHALRECGRSDSSDVRLAAMKLIAIGRQGKLSYVLSENLHEGDETLSKAAIEAMVALARWIATETHSLQRTAAESGRCRMESEEPDSLPSTVHSPPSTSATPSTSDATAELYHQLLDNRPEIEFAVARALDIHRGRHGQDLLRAAMLLSDWPGSKTIAILHTTKHGGQSPMVRRLQQPPAAEHVEAFLLGASHGGLRSHFGVVFSHINEAPVLDALLRKTHWLKDHQLQLCMHQVGRGAWWDEADLAHDIQRRPAADAAKIAHWLAVSGMHDVMQDHRLEQLREHAKDDFPARLRLLRIAAQRPRGASAHLLRSFLNDPDERLMRMAAREIVRRRPADFENALLQVMTTAPATVRRVVSRAIGQEGFEQFWQRFDRMEPATRRQAGRAMLKLLPDTQHRLSRRLTNGPVEQRVKAMQVVQELDLADAMKSPILPLCLHPDAKVRSKAITVMGELDSVGPELILERALNDDDPRVRANAIEVLEARSSPQFVPLLAERARSTHNRERANAIKAMHKLRVSTASSQLLSMLRDQRSEHRISALWTLRHIGFWQLIGEVGNIAKQDTNLRVRRYALNVLKGVAEIVAATRGVG